MNMQAKVTVVLKSQVLDPQGKAVLSGLHALGFNDVSDVRQGKVFFITLANVTSQEAAKEAVSKMSTQLLANPVIETFSIDLIEGSAA